MAFFLRDRNTLTLPAMLAVAVLFLSPGDVLASCGSHAVLPGEKASHQPMDKPAPCGCVGAECGVPDSPLPLPTGNSARTAPLADLLLIDPIAADPLAAIRRTDEDAPALPSPSDDPIFHPPRA